MIAWLVAGSLALATGMRIGWALANRQSVVSSAMIVALGSLAALAALNWPPLTRLVDTAVGRPNVSVGFSQLALIASAAGSCVMITSVATTQSGARTRRLAGAQYGLAALIALVTMALFLAGEPQPEMTPREFVARNLDSSAAWLTPLLYVLLVMALVTWAGMRLSSPSRRGRALFVFSAGTALIVATAALLLIRGFGADPLAGVGTGAVLLLCALSTVAAGSLMPAVEDWVGARREMRLIAPLQQEMERRHPDIGIGVRPRGPLVFRVAERLSGISDAIYLEATVCHQDGEVPAHAGPSPGDPVDPVRQAQTVARWLAAGPDGPVPFPGGDALRQPSGCSDREWILAIARQYREITRAEARS